MLREYRQSYKNCFLLSLSFAVIISVCDAQVGNVFAESTLDFQEIEDPTRDWNNMQTHEEDEMHGDNATDIAAVQSYAREHSLNSTLWLYDRFNSKPNYSHVNYGMLIDSDFDTRTGFGGIDYQLEISWNNSSGMWDYTLKRWAPNTVYSRTIEVMHNYTEFFGQDDEEYSIVLSLNLDLIGSPFRYKVVYYAEAVIDDVSFVDFTTWIPVPKMHMVITTSPSSIELRKGEAKTIEVNLNSSQGYEPNVQMNATSNVKNVKFEFPQNDTLTIPTYGLASIPLTITTLNATDIGTYRLRISAESKLNPQEQIDLSSMTNSMLGVNYLDAIAMTPQEGVSTQTSVLVNILEPLTWDDQVGELWTKVGGPITFMYGILAGISPWIYTRIKNQVKNNNKKKTKGQ